MTHSSRFLHRTLDRLYGKAEEINGADRCETYLFRWTVARIGKTKVYLHHFVGDDWSRDLHDHPKRFVSIGVWGAYEEEFARPGFPEGFPTALRVYRAPWFRTFPAEHRHRLTTPFGDCWTLVIVGEAEREWGFWNEGEFIPWDSYVNGWHSDIADDRRSCP